VFEVHTSDKPYEIKMNRLMLLLIFAGALFASASEDLSAADLSEDPSDLSEDLFVQTNQAFWKRRRRRFFGGFAKAVSKAAKSVAAGAAAAEASRASLTEAEKNQAAREIVFDGHEKWKISDGNGNEMGSVTCPCSALDKSNKAGWPDKIAEVVRKALADLDWKDTSAPVKAHKSELIKKKVEGCVALFCDRCLQSTKTKDEGGSCQKDWNAYNELVKTARRSDATEAQKCGGSFGGYYRTHNTWGYRPTANNCCSVYGAHMGHVWADSSQRPCNKAEGCGKADTTLDLPKWACNQGCPVKEGYSTWKDGKSTCPGMANVQRSDKLDRLLNDDVQVGAGYAVGGTSWCW